MSALAGAVAPDGAGGWFSVIVDLMGGERKGKLCGVWRVVGWTRNEARTTTVFFLSAYRK